MPITVLERSISRKLTASAVNPSIELSVIAFGSEDEVAVLAAVEQFLPLLYLNLALIVDSVDLDPQGGGVWYGAATYGVPTAGNSAAGEPFESPAAEGETPPAEQPQPPEEAGALGPEHSIDIAGVTVHITQSLETVGSFVNAALALTGADPPNYKGAIQVTKDGVEGTDILAGQMSWTSTFKFRFVTKKFLDTLKSMVGKVNKDEWWKYAPRCARFDGAQVRIAADRTVEIAFKFTTADTDFFQTIGTITIPIKRGWDHLWFTYAPDTSNGFLVDVPQTAHVERVLKEADFKNLGIGV